MKDRIEKDNLARKERADKVYLKRKNGYDINIKQWEKEQSNFIKNQTLRNEAIDKQKKEFIDKNPEAIINYCDMVLSNSVYPDSFPQQFDIDYIPDINILIVDYLLPNPYF